MKVKSLGEVNKENLGEIRTQEPNYESDDVLFVDGYDTHKLNAHTVNFSGVLLPLTTFLTSIRTIYTYHIVRYKT